MNVNVDGFTAYISGMLEQAHKGAELKVMHRPAGWPIKYMHASKKHIHAKLGCFGQRLVIAPSVLAGLNPTCLQSLML